MKIIYLICIQKYLICEISVVKNHKLQIYLMKSLKIPANKKKMSAGDIKPINNLMIPINYQIIIIIIIIIQIMIQLGIKNSN